MVSATRDASCCLESPEAEFAANDNDPKDEQRNAKENNPSSKMIK